MNKFKKTLLFSVTSAFCALSPIAQAADSVSYNNVFMSYYSPDDVKTMATYAKEKGLGGYILWEFRGDMPYGDDKSLLKTLNEATQGTKPLIMGYWTNWGLYSDDSNTRAIPEPSYGVPGSLDKDANSVTNKDFTAKLDGMNAIVYSFVEAQAKTISYYDQKSQQMVSNYPNQTPNKIGTLYFNDPWADLAKPGKNNTQDTLCAKNSAICNYALQNRKSPIADKDGMMMGNFNAFVKQQNSQKNLKKFISIGGYGHNDTFEDTFEAPNGIKNFVDSAKAIVDSYGIDGIDLDYENPEMSAANATKYVELIKALREALPNTTISIALLGNPQLLETIGRDNLTAINNNVQHINFMTYDFHGAFDYTSDGKGTTGFLTNVYMPKDAPTGYKFSIDTLIDKALDMGLDPQKISIGIPAYGRAIAGIDSSNEGLFQPITSTSTIPKGDLDAKDCVTTLSVPLNANACSGSFQYKYIVNNMLNNGFSAKTWTAPNGEMDGTTAYAKTFTPDSQEGLKLEVTNTGVENAGDKGFNLTISNGDNSFTIPDYVVPGLDKSYDGATTQPISNQKGLVVKWKMNWGTDNDPVGQCNTFQSTGKSTFDFTKPMHLMIKVHADNTSGKYVTTCDIKPLQ